LQTFDEIALALMALGYTQVSFSEIECRKCGGIWRIAAEDDYQARCPKCGAACFSSGELARGFTRKTLPIVEKAFGENSLRERINNSWRVATARKARQRSAALEGIAEAAGRHSERLAEVG
jgi:hypothetical protein